jgi:hypothetical protein
VAFVGTAAEMAVRAMAHTICAWNRCNAFGKTPRIILAKIRRRQRQPSQRPSRDLIAVAIAIRKNLHFVAIAQTATVDVPYDTSVLDHAKLRLSSRHASHPQRTCVSLKAGY